MSQITDQAILSEMQRHLIEVVNGGLSWESDLWTVDEVHGYLNQRQNRFLRETMLLQSWANVPYTPSQLRHDLPTDFVALARVVWKSSTGVFYGLPRTDGFAADYGDSDWPTASESRPRFYMEAETPTRTIQVAPVTTDTGSIEILYVALSAVLGNEYAEFFTVPDLFVPAVKWGTLADMLAKVGRGQDNPRAGYCESRYREGVMAALLLQEGQ